MNPFDDTTNLVAFLLLLARLGDAGSTYLATPTLKLEAKANRSTQSNDF